RNVFEVLQRASGINFVFDRDVRTDQRTSIALRDATIEEAIRMAMLTNSLENKVLSENTVFVYPNTPQKQREYQELVVKGFYLSNADVKQTANMIRTLVKTRDIFIDEKINLLVLKDTPAAIQLAQRLIAAQDLAEPEVMLEVEVMEVNRNKLLELGIKYPDTLAIGLVGAAGTPGTLTLREWHNRNPDMVQLSFTNPLFLFALQQQDGVSYQLGTRTAATNLRLRDGETQVLAGLISNDERRSADRIPLLGELPIAGRLFSHTLDNNTRTEIVLLITPRLARTLARPDAASV